VTLERRDRTHGEGTLDLVDAVVGETAVAHLSLGHELEDCAPRLLDRNARVAVVRL